RAEGSTHLLDVADHSGGNGGCYLIPTVGSPAGPGGLPWPSVMACGPLPLVERTRLGTNVIRCSHVGWAGAGSGPERGVGSPVYQTTPVSACPWCTPRSAIRRCATAKPRSSTQAARS